MTGSRLELLQNYPFRRLDQLLAGIEPDRDPLFLHVGEPQGAVPDFVATTVAENSALFGKYPPPAGSVGYNGAVAGWLEQRYHLNAGAIDAKTQVTALCGTREGLFQAALMAVLRKRDRMADDSVTPAVLMPNPMYHVYFGGAVVAGAEPILVNSTAENGFVPNYADIDPDILDRTAICFLCSPGNPTGAVASQQSISEMLALAWHHDFVLAVDECYSEIWFNQPPAGGFDSVREVGSAKHLLVFNSLSKRSGSPGLRCGFAAGDPDLIGALSMLRGYGGAQVSGPLMAAGEALWRDEEHVENNRIRYNALVTIADGHLSDVPGYSRPEAGFFLWLNTAQTLGSGEMAAKRLWRDAGVKVLPGRFMSRPDPETGHSPGDDYIRIALVHASDVVNDALARVAAVLRAG